MALITRRNFMQTAAAGLAMPALLRGARAAEPLKVGLVYLGPIGDYGWTWAHEQGRKAVVDALKGQVVADYVENVKEDASATPIIKDLAQAGHKLIFATTFGYMDQTVEADKQFPDVKFEHCTGYKHADNLGTYNSRFHQGRAGRRSLNDLCGRTGNRLLSEMQRVVNASTQPVFPATSRPPGARRGRGGEDRGEPLVMSQPGVRTPDVHGSIARSCLSSRSSNRSNR